MATAAEPTPLREQARALPDEPGVYLFRDAEEQVLYVGKARSLRKRVLSYFRKDQGPGYSARKAVDILARAVSVEPVVATSETEALLLEQNLIKRHRPPFNVRLRDDKSYPYIAVTVDDEYPRVMFTREKHRRGVLYFGPYASALKVRTTLETLNKVFPYRPCEGPQPGRRSGVPCLDHHIGRCAAPCVGLISHDDYRRVIDDVIEFLSGRTKRIERELERRMRVAATSQQYEEAARLRNRLNAVRHLAQRQSVAAGSDSYDVVAIAREGATANVQLFPVRGGRLDERRSFTFDNAGDADDGGILAGFLVDLYAQGVPVPPLIVVGAEIEDCDLLEQFLAERREAKVEIRQATRGDKRRMLDLATRNAALALRHDALMAERTRARRAQSLEELREALNLEVLPLRIECFDVSNLHATNTVASMVVFEDAVAKRAHYRSFGIRHGGLDDFRSISEAVSRRFARMRQVDEDGYDRSFAEEPNLVVIDGGKGQLSSALDAMAAFDLPRVAVIGLAKQEEEIFLPGRPEPVVLPRDSLGLQLLQRVRDEAHRFALGHHRKRRGKAQTASLLDELPGVGPARKRALTVHFGDAARLLAASREELEAVPGVPPAVGRKLFEHLHRTGGGAPG